MTKTDEAMQMLDEMETLLKRTEDTPERMPKKPRLVWDENGITLYADDRPLETTPLSDTKLTASSAWRWNI